jgi:hypothetical protein
MADDQQRPLAVCRLCAASAGSVTGMLNHAAPAAYDFTWAEAGC